MDKQTLGQIIIITIKFLITVVKIIKGDKNETQSKQQSSS